ncbi:MAG TPA: hypothetical protein DCX03_04400 [Bacteroidales bacterium]|nr:hypothetical protein [Bacteroidales bacterium]
MEGNMPRYEVDVWISETVEVEAENADEARIKACEFATKEANRGYFTFEAINEPVELVDN